ncbi:MAG: Holliday junction branch migration DNA helicase RuvB [Lachnospiraceae bacterium]|nr:Holliday junction branch migration DNA helicase RuvB [Lachnospiraceae bacterium]
MDHRVIETRFTDEDAKTENSLRPKRLQDYIGQERIRENLLISIQAAKQRKEPLDHILLYGPPGLGKTTLAGIIANEMGVKIRVTSGPAIEKPGEMAAVLNGMGEGDILFVDEIHRLNKQVEEVLYPAMEDFAIDILMGKGQNARSIRLNLPRFTLIGATTRAGLLSAPLRDRFGEIHRLEFYTPQELCAIIRNSAKKLDVAVEESGAMELARRSRGTPRLANRILKRVRDFAQVRYDGRISGEVARTALDLMEVDRMGLDRADRRFLMTLMETYHGGPAGVDALAASIGEDAGTIEDLIEPYLLQNGFINRTPRGRTATARAYEHMGLPVPDGIQS